MSRRTFTQEELNCFDGPVTFGPHGHVVLIDVMGSDTAIADAARKSYGKDASDRTPEQLRNLVRFMMRLDHSSPFEMAEMKFGIYLPMDTNRQLIRHRTANVNEYSTRYAEAKEDVATTEPDAWRLQSRDNKQGSDGYLDEIQGLALTEMEKDLHEHARFIYQHRLDSGIAKEQARKDLPLSTYTDLVWKMDLHNLFHFLEKRLDPTAQQEIRELAGILAQFVRMFFPLAWEAFNDYVLCAITLSRMECQILGHFINSAAISHIFGWMSNVGTANGAQVGEVYGMTSREIDEFKAKLEKIASL